MHVNGTYLILIIRLCLAGRYYQNVIFSFFLGSLNANSVANIYLLVRNDQAFS